MARQFVFTVPTTLYHPVEGKRVFSIGEQDPGGAWYDDPPEQRVGKGANKALLQDIEDARGEIEGLSTQLDAAHRDLASANASKLEAEAKVAHLEQRAINAEKTGGDASETAETLTKERDEARAAVENEQARAAKLDADLTDAKATIERLVGELATAQQAAANAGSDEGRIQELETDLANAKAKVKEGEELLAEAEKETKALKAEVAKFDGDKDGKAGGSSAKKA